jgi:hypothetical protein
VKVSYAAEKCSIMIDKYGFCKLRRLFRWNFITLLGITELACGSQAFIATLLFDPSMSALPIIPKQNSVSVGLFTH